MKLKLLSSLLVLYFVYRPRTGLVHEKTARRLGAVQQYCAPPGHRACLEGGGVDEDCCAVCGAGSCASGYTLSTQTAIAEGGSWDRPADAGFNPQCENLYSACNTCCTPNYLEAGVFPNYAVNIGTSNTCEVGEPITTGFECDRAATALGNNVTSQFSGFSYHEEAVSYEHLPNGCLVYDGDSSEHHTFYLNTHNGSATGYPDYHKVCKTAQLSDPALLLCSLATYMWRDSSGYEACQYWLDAGHACTTTWSDVCTIDHPSGAEYNSAQVQDIGCAQCPLPIAGYFPGSDVTQHNALDGDQANMEAALKENPINFATAITAYATGGSSTSKGKYRTLQGFSTGAQGKMYDGCLGCPYRHYKMFYDYYGDFDYADKWVSAALAGTDMTFSSGKFGPNAFSTMHVDARVEAAKKGSAYMHVWMYAVREFEDAIDDCTDCAGPPVEDCNAFSTNSGSVHAWDEGVAFYTGAREGTAQGGDSAGVMVYRLAEKRCRNFGTCTGTSAAGMSQVNEELFKAGGLFATGRDLLQQGHCAEVRPVVEQVVSLMTVPLVQGTLRYAYKVGNVAADQSAKNAAEGSTSAAAVLPMVHYCNAASATVVANNMKFGLVFDTTSGAYVSGTVPDFALVKSALEDTYGCLGITCAHVGALMSGAAPYAGAEACTHAPPLPPSPG